MERELDKLIDAEIERAQEHKFYTSLFNYDEEMENFDEEFCCTECQQQASYFL